jgi:opine dehydrogenase
MEPVTILGGGNTAFAVAANLSLAGAEVTLCEISGFTHMIDPIRENRQIELDGVANRGTADIAQVSDDFGLALSQNEVILLIIPSYGHRAFAEACAPHLRSGQIVVLMPGNIGSLEFARILRQHGTDGVIVAESDTAPYVCRKLTPTMAHIWGVVGAMGLGVFPASESERVQRRIEPFFPGISIYPNVVACGLAAMNPVVHPAGVLLNAGRIERSRGEFYFYDEGVTPGVCQLIYAVDRERLSIAAALGSELAPVDEAFSGAGFGPQGDLWATINGSQMLTQLRAPGALDTRWLTEDVPYGLAAWHALGEQHGVPCPLLRSLVDLISATLGRDFWSEARTLEDLGIAGMDRETLLAFLS